MDETKTRWFRWIAQNSQYLFWGIWGAGTGAFFAVFFSAGPLGGDALRTYLTVLTAAMAGIFGIVSSRGMDSIGDRRKVRRKAYNALVRISAIEFGYKQLGDSINELLAQGIVGGPPRDQPRVDYVTVSAVVTAVKLLKKAGENKPDFDELIDTQQDYMQAALVDHFCEQAVQVYGTLNTDGPDIGLRIQHALAIVTAAHMEIAQLNWAKLVLARHHFQGKVGLGYAPLLAQS